MGKGKRLKAERSTVARPAAGQTRAPVGMLNEAVTAVGDIFGTEANCADAAALLVATARELGYELRPRPVAVFALKPSTGEFAFMGPKATALIPEHRKGAVEDMRPDGKDNGHLVLTSEDPLLLLDPNLRQLGAYGIEAPSVALRIKSTDPDSGDWQMKLADLDLVYILDESHTVLLERFNEVGEAAATDGKALAGLIRRGMSAAQIRLRSR